MKAEEREAVLRDLKARFYDLLASEERIRIEKERVNQEIARVSQIKIEVSDDPSNNP